MKRLESLSEENENLIIGMYHRWERHRLLRHDKKFEYEQGPEFVTIIQREEMLNDIFQILFRSWERTEMKTVAKAKLQEVK